MHKIIFVALLLLATSTAAQIQPIQDEASPPKVVEKRNALLPSLDNDSPLNGEGVGLVFRVVSNIIRNMLSSDGLTGQLLNTVLNLLNIDNIKQQLLLVRRALNVLARFSQFLNKYLPAPATPGSGFSPFGALFSKIRFYTTQPDNVEWVPVHSGTRENPLPIIPDRIQKVIDFATQSTDDVDSANEISSEDSNQPSGGEIVEKEPSSTTSTPEVNSLLLQNFGGNPTTEQSQSTGGPATFANRPLNLQEEFLPLPFYHHNDKFNPNMQYTTPTSNNMRNTLNDLYAAPTPGQTFNYSLEKREEMYTKNNNMTMDLPYLERRMDFFGKAVAVNFARSADMPLQDNSFDRRNDVV